MTKKLLISFALGFGFVFVYLIFSSVVMLVLTNGLQDTQAVYRVTYIDLPLRLPKIVFYYLFPPTAEDYALTLSTKKALVSGLIFATNILIYWAIAFVCLTLWNRFSRPKPAPTQSVLSPPPPPIFDE